MDSDRQQTTPSLRPTTPDTGTALGCATAGGFASFGLRPELLQALERMGFEAPTAIQQKAVPELLQGRDLVGQARTGTGKTAAFGLPLLHRLEPGARGVQVLILTPTRELAMQVAAALEDFASELPDIRVLPIVGGTDFRFQCQQLRRGVQVVVGTPGRVMDHMRQGTLDTAGLSTLVLDEADEMLRMGFIDAVDWVLEQLPPHRQVVLFSATMPAEIRRISRDVLRDPVEVTIPRGSGEECRIRQRFLMISAGRKLQGLQRVLEAEHSGSTIVFTRTKAISQTVGEALERLDYPVAVLNGDVPQAERARTIERFRDGRVEILVATDVAARGLDVDRVTLVINHDAPFDAEAYVHRIGRTGRAGRNGTAILFLTPRERRSLVSLQQAVGRPIEPMEVPDAATIHQRRLDRLRERLSERLQRPSLSREEQALLGELLQRVAAEHEASPGQLALAALELSLAGRPLLLSPQEREWSPLSSATTAPGRQVRGRSGEDRRNRRRPLPETPPEPSMERYRIALGWRDNIRPGTLVGAIANETGVAGRLIGRIQIFDSHSLIDLPRDLSRKDRGELERLRVRNRQLRPAAGPETPSALS